MSDPASSGSSSGLFDLERRLHPIQLVLDDDLRRSRLTVFFRFLLALPHFLWAGLWALVVYVAVIVGWLVALVLGRLPEGLHRFFSAFVRYQTHVYAFFSLAANPFPSFTGAPAYPLDLEIAPAARQNRLTILFRLLLALAAFVVLYVLQLVGYVVMFLAWWVALVTGRVPRGMRDLLAYWLRYQGQTTGYVLLLTDRYPSFSERY